MTWRLAWPAVLGGHMDDPIPNMPAPAQACQPPSAPRGGTSGLSFILEGLLSPVACQGVLQPVAHGFIESMFLLG